MVAGRQRRPAPRPPGSSNALQVAYFDNRGRVVTDGYATTGYSWTTIVPLANAGQVFLYNSSSGIYEKGTWNAIPHTFTVSGTTISTGAGYLATAVGDVVWLYNGTTAVLAWIDASGIAPSATSSVSPSPGAGYTHMLHVGGGRHLFYNQADGSGLLSTLGTATGATTDAAIPAGGFATGWDKIAKIGGDAGDLVLFYRRGDGNVCVTRVASSPAGISTLGCGTLVDAGGPFTLVTGM